MPPKRSPKDCVEHEEKNSDQNTSSSLSPYRLMLHRVSEHLTTHDCKKIAMIIGLTPAEEEKIQDSIDLLRVMEKRNEVSENNITRLKNILKVINSEAASELITQYEKKISEKNSNLLSATEPSNIHPQEQEDKTSTKPASRVEKTERPNHRQEETNPLSFSSSPISENINHVLRKYRLSNDLGKKLKMKDYMTLHKMHLKRSSRSPHEIVVEFLTRLMSYDYRSVLLFKDVESIEESQELNESTKNTQSLITEKTTQDLKLSCRDMIFVILNCCDSFLMQEVISKLALCQLAVPVLLPTLDHLKVVMLLWGLFRVTKVWTDSDSNETHEKVVVQHPFSTVSFLRLGNIDISKSNILNKILGPIQNNDDHPYFLSYEQGGPPSILSQGTVEGVWYLPKAQKMHQHYLRRATCFLNVRGDAEKFPKQRQFVAEFSTLLIVFIKIGNIPSTAEILKELTTFSMVILVVCGQSDTSIDHILQVMGKQVTVLKVPEPNPLDIGKRLCTEINRIHSHRESGSVYSLEHSLPVCLKLNIDVDMQEPLCEGAKKAIQNLMTWRREETFEFKEKVFPLQFSWSHWSGFRKHQTWMWEIVEGNKRANSFSVETEEQLRHRQRSMGMSSEVRKLLKEFLHPDEKYTQFVVLWLQHLLKEHSVESVIPLLDTLHDDSKRFKEITEKITLMKRKLDHHTAISGTEREKIERELKELSCEQSGIQNTLAQTSQDFDKCYLGFEHFIREYAQMHECFHDFPNPHKLFKATFADVNPLPKMAAELLLNGHPLELLDGDACDVPLTWVRAVLSAVSDMTRDARIYVISAIGMQSSGKSTLLNSMFGTRFAVNGGRCTRGMFLQLIPVEDELKKDFGFDYVAVIDTEGFTAHARVGANIDQNLIKRDNKLVTFALCLSDTTLINIDVPNYGEEFVSILQISAHAFIRMRNIGLPSSCYFVQQFLDDVTTPRRDPISVQSILQTLDQAFAVASTEEVKEDHFRKFSDCFKIVSQDSVDNVLYIPNLWGTGKSVPSYDYSGTVLQLKSALLKEGTMQKDKTQMISRFTDKIEDVWKAVEQEDFVFKFRNTAQVVLRNHLSSLYKNAQFNLLQEMIKWELQEKQKIIAMKVDNISIYTLLQVGDQQLFSHRHILEKIEDELKKEEYEGVRHHYSSLISERFSCEQQLKDSIKRVMETELKIITNIKTKNKQLLPQIKEKLQQTATTVTDKLKDALPDVKLNFQKTELDEDTEISNAFQLKWRNQMKIVQANYQIDSDEEIKQRILSSKKACLIQCSQNTGLSMEIKYILSNYNIEDLCSSSPNVSTVDDLREAATSIKTCSEEVSRNLHHLREMLKEELGRKDFVFSCRLLQRLTNSLSLLVKVQCKGCKKRELLVCLACNILHQAYKTRPNNTLATMRNTFLQELKNILPGEVTEILGRMEEDDIEKHSYIPLVHRRHVLDEKFLTLVPKPTSNYDKLLSIIADSEDLILDMLVQFGVYEEISMKSIILTAMLKLSKNKNIAKAAQALALVFICSWGLPICQALQVTFVKEHSMQYLLEQEKEELYLNFKDLCQNAC